MDIKLSFTNILDIFIGLSLIYLILSLVASELQELLAMVCEYRPKHLKTAIKIMLGDDQIPENTVEMAAKGMTFKIYSHPQIASLNQRGFQLNLFNFEWPESQINSNLVAYTLLKVINEQNISLDHLFLLNNTSPKIGIKNNMMDQLPPSENGVVNDLNQLSEELKENICILFSQNNKISAKEMNKSLEKLELTLKNWLGLSSQDAAKVAQEMQRKFAYYKFMLRQSVGPSYIPSNIFATALFDILSSKLNLGGVTTMDEVVGLLEQTDGIHEYLKANLAFLAREAKVLSGNDITQGLEIFKQQIQAWYDSAMQRASGVYKRNTKGSLITIGLLLAILTNTDTFHVGYRLSTEGDVRQAVSQFSPQLIIQDEALKNCLNKTNNPESPCNKEEVKKAADEVVDTLSPFSDLVFWDMSNFPNSAYQQLQQRVSVSSNKWQTIFVGIIRVILGWMGTALAVSMGAPFWFDFLSKFVNVRQSGGKPPSDRNS